ncbi:hypothetical protein GCM10009828_023870 [Actinoplanes couchii]|uniref:NAD-dependent epimerase/dehydratase n=1 Tax=Actinoplanes couchii TaxID=403638 RepID=A0ABQ3X7R1_9ACTN|nr:hypothetical protein Aco03nite_029500 [Actinoplanes couchii]
MTGASGFCGGVVARAAAAAGAEVICLGRNPGPVGEHRFWDATRTVPDLTDTDVVLHLAAAVGDPPPGRASEAAFRAVNVDGTARLLEAAAHRRVVWVSSASVYAPPHPNPDFTPHPDPGLTSYTNPGLTPYLDPGLIVDSNPDHIRILSPGLALSSNPDLAYSPDSGLAHSSPPSPGRGAVVPGPGGSGSGINESLRSSPKGITEDHPLAGMTAYGRTKAEGERLALEAGAVVLRPRAVYGPGDPHLLPRLQRVVRGGRALLPGPDVLLSLTAVENLADACLTAAGRQPHDDACPTAADRQPHDDGCPTAAGRQPHDDGCQAIAGRQFHDGGCLAAADRQFHDLGVGWPTGAYNIADATPYRRDSVVAAVCGVPVVHVPIPLVNVIAAVSSVTARMAGRAPLLSRYAVEQLTTGVVLDISRARAQGWTPRRTLTDFLGRSLDHFE